MIARMERDPRKDPTINALGATIFTTNIGGGIILAIISLYAYHLSIDLRIAGLVISMYAIARAITQPIIGQFIDRIDPRPVITIGIIIFIFSSAAMAIPDPTVVFISRAMQGVGSGIVAVSCFTIIARLYVDAHLRRQANARFMALEMTGIILGPFVGAFVFGFTDSFASPFIVCSMFGVIALAWFLRMRKNIGGGTPVVEHHKSQKDKKRITFAPQGLSILILISSMNMVLLFIWGSLQFIMPLFAISIGISKHLVGYLFGTLSFGMIFTIWLTQRGFFGKIPVELLIVVGNVIALASLTVMVLTADFWVWLFLFWVMGAGVGTLVPILPSLAADAIVDRPGQGISYLELGGNLGFILGPIVSAFLAEGDKFGRAFALEVAASSIMLVIAIILIFVRHVSAGKGGKTLLG